MSLTIYYMQLSSCWGCHQSLLNAHFELLPILPELDFVFWSKENNSLNEGIGRNKVGIIEGVIRTEKDTANVRLLRENCDIIISLGACACYGSIPGLANLNEKDELINREFIKMKPSLENELEEPNFQLPNFEKYIYNVKDIIHVDMFIPGCPPKTENIIAAISYLKTFVKNNSSIQDKDKCVCDYCNLYNKGCLLDVGKLCYGAITAAGCKLMCPNNGDICFGCFKHTDNPGKKVKILEELIVNINQLNEETRRNLQHFLTLYLGAPNITNFYFYNDLIQRLAYEPESFNQKEKKYKDSSKVILDINPTGIEINDEIIGSILFLLKSDPNFKFSSKTVCSHCDRTIVDKVPIGLKRDYEGLPTTDKCFLEQGYICLGLVTQAGCGTLCPNKANAPCLGCYGPPVGVKDQGIKFISTLGSLYSDRDPEEIIENIKDPVGLFNRFTLADSILGHKNHENINDV
ncbi:MAG: hypothetical protein ACFE85_06470 [Candidatus Hodarchaeota archaeon]